MHLIFTLHPREGRENLQLYIFLFCIYTTIQIPAKIQFFAHSTLFLGNNGLNYCIIAGICSQQTVLIENTCTFAVLPTAKQQKEKAQPTRLHLRHEPKSELGADRRIAASLYNWIV
ncbi:MAG: hypothetical protein A2189_00455 [Paenibacillus sp. RIFOXYA1_FULL_44_5]|nr:MAG: hypothetical protein A2189_00455 [Paenibacillus sp. RIFOXYA1_FULL_44_5]